MLIASSRRRFPMMPALVIAIVVAGGLGAVIPAYVGFMGDDYAKLAALPAALLLAFLLVYSRTALLLLMILMRGSTELLFESSRFSIGDAQLGVGGLINGFAILIAFLLVLEKPELFSKILVKVWGPFLAVLTFATCIAPDRGEAVRLYLQLLSNFAVFVGAYYFVRSDKDFRTCVRLVVWSSVIPAIYGFIELATGGGHGYPGEGLRIRATFSHPNVFAFYLTLVVALALYMLKSASFALSAPKRAVLGIYLVVLLALLVLTKTRSAWVACFAVFFGYALLFERRYFVYLILAGVVGLFVPGVGDRLLDLTHGTGNGITTTAQLNSFAWRVSIWKSGLDYMTPSHYLTGYGLEAFKSYSVIFFKDANGINWGAHNIYVEIMFEMGLVGIAAFAWMYAQLLILTKSLVRVDRLGALALLFVIIQYLVVSASDNMLHYLSFNWYLWFIFGAGTAYATLHGVPATEGVGGQPRPHGVAPATS